MSREFVHIAIKHLRARAKNRPTGYVEDVISHGTLKDGFVILDIETHRKLVHKYTPTVSSTVDTCPHCNGAPAKYIPDIPSSQPTESELIRAFRQKFLGPLEEVPSEVAHLRAAMEQRKTERNSAGCSGCELGSIMSEFTAKAWRHYRKVTASR